MRLLRRNAVLRAQQCRQFNCQCHITRAEYRPGMDAAVFPPSESQPAALTLLLQSNPTIILGTESKSRKAIMAELASQLGFSFTCTPAKIDEQALGSRESSPEELVLLLARAKADAIKAQLPARQSNSFLITCDQVVVFDGMIREKPVDAAQAREFISGYSVRPSYTIGSTCVTNMETDRACEAVDKCEIRFSHIPEEVIDKLVEEGDIMYCAGGLMIEHPLTAPLISGFTGSQDSIMGLSKATVKRLLVEAAEL